MSKTGLEDLPLDYFRLPELRIKQNGDSEKVPNGQWFTTREAVYHSLGRDLIVLNVHFISDDGIQLTLLDLMTGLPCVMISQDNQVIERIKEIMAVLQAKCSKFNLPMWRFAIFALTIQVEDEKWLPVFGNPYSLEADSEEFKTADKLRDKFKDYVHPEPKQKRKKSVIKRKKLTARTR